MYSYQCYSSIKTGTVRTRLNKGMSIEGICPVPMIPGWKLAMMAKRIFKEFSKDIPPIADLALSIIDKHKNDKKKQVDNTDMLRQHDDERARLQKRLDNLIEMRADGEITKEMFQAKASEIKIGLKELEENMKKLEQTAETNNTSPESKTALLKQQINQMVCLSDDGDVPDGLLHAFVSKIVVHEDSFDWYLRFRSDNGSAAEPQKVAEYTFTKEDAKKYLYSFSPQRRVLKWSDIKVTVFI